MKEIMLIISWKLFVFSYKSCYTITFPDVEFICSANDNWGPKVCRHCCRVGCNNNKGNNPGSHSGNVNQSRMVRINGNLTPLRNNTEKCIYLFQLFSKWKSNESLTNHCHHHSFISVSECAWFLKFVLRYQLTIFPI